MISCICMGISDKMITQAIEKGADTVSKVQEKTGIGMCCGICLCRLEKELEEEKKKKRK